ncbi:Acyl-CoA dehydrogenase [Amycolatopsis arida]|uniref:Acyl-CoA dehydrogenase n=1 Tax=Amycolatopsis arida TaxID=587909 RepID=A0A1I5M445_9PSEU|nr:acyl-CoA dehydrogenase family protein [Amycolatopsis arida]TDX93959.1 alkylation response protein AidB-like acyl-CoA dehydrogenase [Amycolatopsis arida]SFP04253.1 Acyl-CoA dehydrogenase [Amycolatopsis arida]
MSLNHPLGPPESERHWVATAAELATGFAATAAEHDDTAELPVGNLRVLHASGLDAALLPRELGGEALSYRSFGEIVRILAAACPSTACVWLMHVGAATVLVQLSTPDMAGCYASEFRAGRRFANALSEPSSGNLFLMPLQEAEPVPGGYRLTGAKRFVSGCEIADHLLVNALVDGQPAFFGHAPDETVRFEPIWDAMGLRASRSQLVRFDGTVLRAERRCPPPDPEAPPRPNHIAAGLAFLSLGIADAALAALLRHARSRTLPTTGEPLGALQWVRFAVADARLRLDSAVLYAWHMAWLADQCAPEFEPAALRAKPLANEVARDIAQLGVRVGGGSGYLRSSPIQRHFRDAQAPALMAYSVEVCKDRVGQEVLAEGTADAP